MNPRLVAATAARVLRQLRADHRTVALLVVVPCVLIGLLSWVYNGTPVFDRIGAALLGVFPFTVMFVVTSVATLRERASGTLERLLTTPMAKADFMFGYALAFGLAAVVQALIATGFAVYVAGLDVRGPLWALVVVAVADAVLGSALGLLASGFANSEFQAVQFMPAVVLPQFLLCGLILPRDQLPSVLQGVSDVLPLSFAVDAMQAVAARTDPWGDVGPDMGVIAVWIVGALLLGSLTLRRRTE
ncbi:MAG: ABC transporter permease [Thermoleophilia bacterium]|nr:ABC transporter permease [Thermoleophilia bacterium]